MLFNKTIRNILITYASEHGLPYPLTVEQSFNAVCEWVQKYAQDNINPPQIRDGKWYIWDSETSDYKDSGVSANGTEGPKGDTGVGITDVEVTPHSTDAQGGNVYQLEVKTTDQKTIEAGTFTAPRGPQGLTGIQGPVGPTGPEGQRGPQGLQGVSVVSVSVIPLE